MAFALAGSALAAPHTFTADAVAAEHPAAAGVLAGALLLLVGAFALFMGTTCSRRAPPPSESSLEAGVQPTVLGEAKSDGLGKMGQDCHSSAPNRACSRG